MSNKKVLNLTTFFIMLLLITVLFCGAGFNEVISSNSQNVNGSILSGPNTQKYVTSDGSDRTILWAQGITPPLMADDETLQDNLGKPGSNYFEKFEDNTAGETYVKYKAPVKDGAGYYDLNKNPDRTDIYPQQVAHHCYLASALNILYWWLDQNSNYIDIYTSRLESGNFYKQPDTLISLYPYNKTMWNEYRISPTLSKVKKGNKMVYSHELSDSKIYQKQMQAYQTRDEGYYSNGVWDYFINGYLPEQPNGLNVNTPDAFIPSKFGGFFYPLFGKQPISHLTSSGNFDVFQEGLKKAFSKGQAVVLNYQSSGLGTAHAITCWGAEFDENGILQKVYITDSDDFDATDVDEKTDTMYGMVSFNVKKSTTNGLAILTSKTTEVSKGPELMSFAVLDLMTDEFIANTTDNIEDPVIPNIIKQPKSASYSAQNVNIDTLEIEVKKEDSGYFSYQWYKSTEPKGKGEIIPKATNKWYTPEKPSLDPTYYYCVVTNNKNGKISSEVESNRAEISINTELTDAAVPAGLNYINGGDKLVSQYQKLKGVKVEAYSPDGGELSYQWYHKVGTDFSPTGGEKLIGETSNVFYPPTYLYEVVGSTAETHTYYCVVTNTNNKVNGNKVASASPKGRGIQITVTKTATLQNAYDPYIVTNPIGAVYNLNDTIKPLYTFGKTIDGGVISYQWYLNGEKVNGATNNTYTPNITNPGKYYVQCEIINTNSNATNLTTSQVRTELITIEVKGTKPASSNNNLSSLTIKGQTLTPLFQPKILSYELTVNYDVTSVQIEGTLEESNASVVGLGKHNLKVGKNEILINVTAENGDIKTYKITVTREDKPYVPSSNTNLSKLEVENYKINPSFQSNILNYTLTVPYGVTEINIIGKTEDMLSQVTGLKRYNLKVGQNEILIKVTAENGDTKTYKIIVTREEIVLPENFLQSITVNGMKINIENGKRDYKLNVDNSVDVVDIKGIFNFGVIGNVIVEGDKILKEGDNYFTIKVTEKNGNEQIYNLIITKEEKLTPITPIEPEENNNNNTGMYIGIGVSTGVIVIILTIILIVLIKKKKMRN